MKALTIRQPYASQILRGTKLVEYRSWQTPYRGPLLITVSARADESLAALVPRWAPDAVAREYPLACAFCVVKLWDITGTPGDYAWHLYEPTAVLALPVKGKLGLWTPDAALLERLGLATGA